MKLNQHNLDVSNQNIDWTGGIAHEMLRSLGHKHKNNDYSNQ